MRDFTEDELEITELPERDEMLVLNLGSLHLATGGSGISILGLITL